MLFSKILLLHLLCFEPHCFPGSTSSYSIESKEKKKKLKQLNKQKYQNPKKQTRKKTRPALRKHNTSAYAYATVVYLSHCHSLSQILLQLEYQMYP